MRLVLSAVLMVCALTAAAEEIPNQLIDYRTFQQNVIRVGELREKRRISEAQFIRMAGNADTIVLDARSRLYAYGYTNVFELGPLVDIHETRIAFEGTLAG